MQTVDVSSLATGSIAQSTYYSLTGELLISKGIVISQEHVDALSRRHISSILSREDNEQDELQQLLTGGLQKLDELIIDEPAGLQMRQPVVIEDPDLDIPPLVLALPELKIIKGGEEGLQQLLSGARVDALDKKISDDLTADKPVGPPLHSKARLMSVAERTPDYKQRVTTSYESALSRIRNLLNELVNCRTIDGGSVRSIVEMFIKMFIADRTMLLNLATIKPSDNDYIFHHSLNVCLLSISIAASAGYCEEQVVEIGIGALLHDVGMLLVPRHIRLKKGKLNRDEWFEIQKHPILSLHILEKIERLPGSAPIIAYQNHERENAKGYPKQRHSRFIHNFAKIVMLADIFEAFSSRRTHREEFLPYKAMEGLIKMARQGFVSSEFIKAFLGYTSLFPIGSMVELNDGRIARVIQSNSSLYAKPIVSILGEKGKPFPDKSKMYQEDLKTKDSLQIVRPLPNDTFKNMGIMDGF